MINDVVNRKKGIRRAICHAVHRYAKASNKYMKNYNQNINLSYIQYLEANNLYGWEMSHKITCKRFWMGYLEWVISSLTKKV